MLVKNKTTSVISIPSCPSSGGEIGRLLPGVNDVSPAVWAEVKASMALHLETEAIEVVELEPSEVADSSPVTSISKIAQKALVKLIAETTDAELLNAWRNEESSGNKRVKVLDAIAKQLEAVKPPPPAIGDQPPAGDPAEDHLEDLEDAEE